MSAAATYAEALYEAAHERGELEQTLEDLQGFLASVEENGELRLFYHSDRIAMSQKRRAIDGLAEQMTLSARNFLKVLSDNDRTEMLDDVVRNYEALVEEYLGRVEVELVTAVEVSDETLERIRTRLGRIMEDREVVLERRVEPDLIGGAVFNLSGKRIDGSIRGQLRSLRETMLERGVASG